MGAGMVEALDPLGVFGGVCGGVVFTAEEG
jgi:hypothetical protein